jgi:lysophospholipase L1-like esterase
VKRLAALAALLLAARGALAQTPRALAFGDSITLGTGDDPTRVEQGYPPRLEALLAQAGVTAEVENHGVGGERTPEGLERIDSVLAGGGNVLLLMEGSNDISREISIETTRFNLREMGRKAEAQGIAVVHATVIPRIPQARIDPNNITTQRLNENIRDLAAARGRELTDPFEALWVLPNRFSTHYWYSPDDFVGHPNATGYDLMARVFFEVLRDIDHMPPVTGIVDPFDGERSVPGFRRLDIDLFDFGSGIDPAGTALLINGTPVTATVTGEGLESHISYSPPAPWSGIVTVGLRARDRATPPNAVDRQIIKFYTAGTVFLGGDVDRNGRVDGNDLVVLARSFGARLGNVRYTALADFNTDGSIDGVDLAVLASNFGNSI